MITGPQRKFCEAFALEQNGTAAYLLAYPKSSKRAGCVGASRLLSNADILAEIERIRRKAEEKAGSAVLTLAEKRKFVARLLRAKVGELPPDSDLFNAVKHGKDGTEYKLPDKLRAIEVDNDLAGEGSEAGANDALGELLKRVRK